MGPRGGRSGGTPGGTADDDGVVTLRCTVSPRLPSVAGFAEYEGLNHPLRTPAVGRLVERTTAHRTTPRRRQAMGRVYSRPGGPLKRGGAPYVLRRALLRLRP